MKNRTILILLYTLAIALLFGFSFLPSGFRVYRTILSLFLPFAIGVGIFVKKNGTKPPMYQGEGRDALPYLLFAPILLGILLLSVLTTLLFSLVGLSNPPIDKIPIGEAIVLYALLPAILEEALYRILPALALCDEDTHSVCIFSTLVFSLAHISIFSIFDKISRCP